jgi:hypothetical protein
MYVTAGAWQIIPLADPYYLQPNSSGSLHDLSRICLT